MSSCGCPSKEWPPDSGPPVECFGGGWPKLFQNLRITGKTELADDFPMHVVCQWIGNSQPIAAKHSLQVTDDHFSESLQIRFSNPPFCLARGRKSGWPRERKPLFCRGMQVGTTTREMAKYPRQESNQVT